MYPRHKNWSYNKPDKAPNRALEIINPAIITAEASPSGVLLDGKGKERKPLLNRNPKKSLLKKRLRRRKNPVRNLHRDS